MNATSVDNSTDSLMNLRIGGTEVNYFVLCPRKLWWFSHGMEQEHNAGASGTSRGQENVDLGTQLHQDSYQKRGQKRELLLDGLLRLDFTEGGAVQEVKKSRGGTRSLRAARMQLLYYLFYLKREKGIETTGVLEFPKERRREEVVLTSDAEAEIETLLADLTATRDQPTPPPVDEPMSLCRKCAYEDLCWG